MYLVKRNAIRFLIISLFLTSFAVVRAYYVPTGRDTLPAPESFTYEILDPTGLELLYSTDNFEYYFRDSLDTLVIHDLRNGYTWKTGTDLEFNKDIDDNCDDMIDRFEDEDPEDVITDEMLLEVCIDKELRLNTLYTGFANSLISIEYFDDANNVKRTSSASYEDVTSVLKSDDNDPSHFRLEVDFEDLLIQVNVHIYLDDLGVRYEVKDEEVGGFGIDRLAAIIIAPFTGASGGAYEKFDLAEMDYGDEEFFKDKIPGYTLVPDGSGSLIRFNDNAVKLQTYESTIYGIDPSLNVTHESVVNGYVPFKTASMPVFGIAHGNLQAAFVAFATSGEEFMKIVSTPEDNLTYYNFTYPRFQYNKKYLQIYNKNGDGYLTTYDERFHFDINMRYNFLAGDGDTGFQADYVGMALSYREYLISEGILHEVNSTDSEIPIRLDFFMSDVERGITGYNNQVTSTVDDVRNILNDIVENIGISNINSGLLGWADGGVTLGDPRDTDYTREIGRERDFEDLIKDFNDQGIDISLSQDYFNINEETMTLRRNAAKHTSTWYSRIYTFSYPVGVFYYARPVKSVSWMLDQTNEFDKLGVNSYTITGVTSNLISDYTTDMYRDESSRVINEGFKELNEDKLVNAHQPNMYIWEYVDRYLDTPVYGSQFLIETDTVPFLQLVLANTMELYAPYSNFSFYTDKDVLRMIDYNIYPSFVLTENPAYLLSDTNSSDFYSTEYDLYVDLIESIYETVDDALSSVIGVNWINRLVVENGVILNTYENGVEILINYTDDQITYNGVDVQPLSYEVIGGGKLMFGKSKKDLSDKQILKKIQSGSHQNKNAYLFLMPWLIGFVILTIGPFFYTIVLSFYDVAQTGLGYDMTFIGFDNYILAFFTNTSFVPAMIEFITLEITYVPAIIIASFILGTLLNRELKFRSGFRTIFFLPVIVLSGSVMDKLIDTESNRLSDFSENIIFQMVMNYNVDAARALLTLFENFTMVLWFTGIPIILFINGLQKINSQLYEAAKIDGANSWQILWKITVPIIKPTALIVSIFTIVQIGMYNINPVFYLIRDSMYNIAAGLGVASAFTWIYTIVVLLFVGVALLLLGSREKKAEVKLSSIQKLNFERIKLKRDTVVKEVNNG